MAAILRDGTLTLSGTVGAFLFEDGFTASQVDLALSQIEDDAPLTVRVNSGGGYADEGTAIYNALRARAGSVHIIVTALAASAGSVIAMAGTRITMAPGSLMMAHEPMISLLNANSDDLASAAQAQAAYVNSSVAIYARRTKRSAADIRAMLRQTVWFDAEGAVAAGFADDVDTDEHESLPAFDYGAYAKAPERLVALAKDKSWSLSNTLPLDARAEKARADRAEAELVQLRAYKAEREREEFNIETYEARRLAANPNGQVNARGLTGPDTRFRAGHERPHWGAFLKGE